VVFKYAAPQELSADELERVRQRLSAKLGDDVSLQAGARRGDCADGHREVPVSRPAG